MQVQEDPLQKWMATHSSILAWRIPWTDELGGLQSQGCKESDMTERLSKHTEKLKANRVCKCPSGSQGSQIRLNFSVNFLKWNLRISGCSIPFYLVKFSATLEAGEMKFTFWGPWINVAWGPFLHLISRRRLSKDPPGFLSLLPSGISPTVSVPYLCLSHTSVLGPILGSEWGTPKDTKVDGLYLESSASSLDQDISHADFQSLAFCIVPCASDLTTECHVGFPKKLWAPLSRSVSRSWCWHFSILFIYLISGCTGSSLLLMGFSLVVVSGGYSSLWHAGFSLWWFLLLGSAGSGHMGFSSCSSEGSVVVVTGLPAPQHAESSQTRD